MKGNKKIDAQAILDELKNGDLSNISEAVKNGNFSKEEIDSIQNDVEYLVLTACKTKLSLELRFLSEEEPTMILRDVIVKMLNLLPEDIEEAHIPILTEFIIEKWKSISQKLAA